MGGSHCRAIRAGQQHGQAVGHHDGAGYAGAGGDGGISRLAVRRIRIKFRYVAAMHLLQKNRPRARAGGQRGAV